MTLIDNNKQRIADLCRKHKVSKLFVFGSILTNKFNSESDVDFLVNFNNGEVEDPFLNFFDFKSALQDLLGRDVDLVDERAIRNPYFKTEIDKTKSLIYG